jgi:hypothetical protein
MVVMIMLMMERIVVMIVRMAPEGDGKDGDDW